MALVHHEKKEINAKIVYYGPGLSGKSTNLKFLYEKMKPEYRGQLKFLNTRSGKMLFFDFMRPDQIGIQGYDVRFHIYTVPDEIADFAIWKTVLKGMDGLVFVADSEPYRLPDNLLSLEKLNEYLETQGKAMTDVPCLFQCNKQDLPGATTLDEMKDILRATDYHMIPASAHKGEGVLNTLSTIVKMVVQTLRQAPPVVEENVLHAPATEEPVLSSADSEIRETPPEPPSSAVEEVISETVSITTSSQELMPNDTEPIAENETAAFSEHCEETVESAIEPPSESEEEVICEPPPTFISFSGFTASPAINSVETEELDRPFETIESSMAATEIDFAGEFEQVAPGHLRLPITVKYGQVVKRISINLKLSVESPEN
jgi:signal recognition particle receptor subunit beta